MAIKLFNLFNLDEIISRPNKAWLFEGSFFWWEGSILLPFLISRRTNLMSM